MTVEEVVVMCLLGCVVVLVGHLDRVSVPSYIIAIRPNKLNLTGAGGGGGGALCTTGRGRWCLWWWPCAGRWRGTTGAGAEDNALEILVISLEKRKTSINAILTRWRGWRHAHRVFHSQSSQGSRHSRRSRSRGTGGWPGQQRPRREAEQPDDRLYCSISTHDW